MLQGRQIDQTTLKEEEKDNKNLKQKIGEIKELEEENKALKEELAEEEGPDQETAVGYGCL